MYHLNLMLQITSKLKYQFSLVNVPVCTITEGLHCDGIASHSGGVEILLVVYCYRNRDKLWQYEPLGLRLSSLLFKTANKSHMTFKIVLSSTNTPEILASYSQAFH